MEDSTNDKSAFSNVLNRKKLTRRVRTAINQGTKRLDGSGRSRNNKDACLAACKVPKPTIRNEAEEGASALNIVEEILSKDIHGITRDYLQFFKGRPNPAEYSSFLLPENRPKNRYRDILCLELSRVKLKDHKNDYIHANYVKTLKGEKTFIATQGPLEKTCADFWRMTFDEVEFIVMLCQFIEEGRTKCFKYYPNVVGQALAFGGYVVTCVKENETTDLNLKDLQLKVECEGVVKNIRHINWISWPDRLVPPLGDTIINVLNITRVSTKPIVVHCSAGIEKMNAQSNKYESSAVTGKELRAHRYGAIQTDLQYLFAHATIITYLMKNGKLDDNKSAGANRFLKTYQLIFEKLCAVVRVRKQITEDEQMA
uniref:Tyrosine-protein phosphatase domain-containing protein n=1 Tax=Rhabditophanes sp. KR3021 TaxID=114890 RepID=A0AC35UA53_9BILA